MEMATSNRRAFGAYVLFVTLWGALLLFLQPLSLRDTTGTAFWAVEAHQTLLGAGLGFTAAASGLLLWRVFHPTTRT